MQDTLERKLMANVPGLNQTVAQLIVAVSTILGCLAVIVFKPEQATAAFAIITLIAGYYFGTSGVLNNERSK